MHTSPKFLPLSPFYFDFAPLPLPHPLRGTASIYAPLGIERSFSRPPNVLGEGGEEYRPPLGGKRCSSPEGGQSIIYKIYYGCYRFY